MDRGANLASLAEEEEDSDVPEDDGGSWTSSEGAQDEEQGDGGVRKGEPTKFDVLCDGVLSSLGLVHASMHELLELKDELLKHALPPSVLMKIALCTTKVFRSVSDMNMPTSELVRLVRIYSTPWEEKSAALKKLHDDYNSKKAQLNIALKKLEMIDAESKRIAKERRIMNWEKLFARLTTARGHGRRWKFLIETFKEKAKDGVESLQKYVDNMERGADSDVEPDDLEDDREVETQVQQVPALNEAGGDAQPSEEAEDAHVDDQDHEHEHDEEEQDEDEGVGGQQESEEDEEGETDDEDEESRSKGYKDSEASSDVSSPQREKAATYIRPPMKDKEAWTHEPEYDRFLYLRVFQPEGLEFRELKCAINFGDQKHRTQVLDELPQDDDGDSIKDEKEEETSPVADSQLSRRPGGRGRGLIGTRGGRPRAARSNSQREETRRKARRRFEQCTFIMPDEDLSNDSVQTARSRKSEPSHLKIAVHYGAKEEMIAMATVDMDDLDSLDLPTFSLPPPTGDDPLAATSDADAQTKVSTSSLHSPSEESLHSNISVASSEADSVRMQSKAFDPANRLAEMDPVKFPLYSVHAARGDAVHMTCGQLPLVAFWVKRAIPLTFNRATDPVESIVDIVLDETGFDMREVTKEELHKETKDECLSAISLTPEPVEETVPKKQYDKLMQLHEEEMTVLQQEYEDRLQDLVESLQEMQEAQLAPPGHAVPRSPRPTSSGSRSFSPLRSTTPPSRGGGGDRLFETVPRPPRAKVTTEQLVRQRRQVRLTRTLPNWGETLPKNFFDRLRLFEEESLRHKQELSEKTYKETSEVLERRLAGEFKLRNPTDEDIYDAMQDVSLPAVFMPTKSNKANIYNPRAAKYFHPTGASGMRLTQPPSMLQLPPLPKNKISVVNLFDMSHNLTQGGTADWLMQRYLVQEQQVGGAQTLTEETTEGKETPLAPPPTNMAQFMARQATQESSMMHSTPPQKEAVCD